MLLLLQASFMNCSKTRLGRTKWFFPLLSIPNQIFDPIACYIKLTSYLIYSEQGTEDCPNKVGLFKDLHIHDYTQFKILSVAI